MRLPALLMVVCLLLGCRRLQPEDWQPKTSTERSTARLLTSTATVSATLPNKLAQSTFTREDMRREKLRQPHAHGFRLRRVLDLTDPKRRRAEIEDLEKGEMRTYQIGDLLPDGALLVGIRKGRADIFLADKEVVSLFLDGRSRSRQDFEYARRLAALRPVERVRRPQHSLRKVLGGLRGQGALNRGEGEPTSTSARDGVQSSIDALIARGESVVPVLLAMLTEGTRLPEGTYHFPRSVGFAAHPKTVGHASMLVLEAITGERFESLRGLRTSASTLSYAAEAWSAHLGSDSAGLDAPSGFTETD